MPHSPEKEGAAPYCSVPSPPSPPPQRAACRLQYTPQQYLHFCLRGASDYGQSHVLKVHNLLRMAAARRPARTGRTGRLALLVLGSVLVLGALALSRWEAAWKVGLAKTTAQVRGGECGPRRLPLPLLPARLAACRPLARSCRPTVQAAQQDSAPHDQEASTSRGSSSSGGSSGGGKGGGKGASMAAQQQQPLKVKPAVTSEMIRRCQGTLGSWCIEYHTQLEAPAVAAPRGNKTCSLDCNKVGACRCAAGCHAGVPPGPGPHRC